MINQYTTLLNQKLRSNVIQGYEIYSEQSRSFSFSAELNKIKITEWNIDTGVGIRVLKNNRLGFAFGQTKKDADTVVKHAILLSKFNTGIRSFGFAGQDKYKKIKKSYVHPEAEHSAVKTLKDYTTNCIEHKGHVETFSSINFTKMRLINSEGLDISSGWDSIVSLITSFRKKGVCISESLSRPFFDDVFYDLPKTAMSNALLKSKGTKTAFKGTVIIRSSALRSFLAFYLSSFTGIRKHYKNTKFNVGDRVAGKLVTVTDAPVDARGTGRRKSDMEGIASENRTIIDKGILKRFAYNLEYAGLDNVNEKGFCSRISFSSPPGIGYSNILLSCGNNKIKDFEKVAVINSVFGMHTANASSGRFAVPIDCGYILNHGKKTGLRDVMLSGNIFEGFKNIIALGKVQDVNGSIISPWIAVNGWVIV